MSQKKRRAKKSKRNETIGIMLGGVSDDALSPSSPTSNKSGTKKAKHSRSAAQVVRVHGDDDPVVLEFEHVRGHKDGSICGLIQRGFAWAAISAEIQKCEVRCCNCHRRKTAKQYGYRKMLLTSVV